MSLTFTPLFTEHFTPDSNPLDPANWTTVNNAGFGDVQALSGLGQVTAPTIGATPAGVVYTGSQSLTDNQFITLTATNYVALNADASIELFVRADTTFTSYVGLGLYSNADGSATIQIFDWNDSYYENGSGLVSPGDVFTLAFVGGQIYAYQNGALVHAPITATNVIAAGGTPIFDMFCASDISQCAVSNVIIGSASTGSVPYSVPDDRNYSVFPNNAIDVQGTETYVVPAHPSTTPPTDSRAAGAPVDSRTSQNIPTNSRTPGTSGPGE